MIEKVIRDLENIDSVHWEETVEQAIRDLKNSGFKPASTTSRRVKTKEGQTWEFRRTDRHYTKSGWCEALGISMTVYNKVLGGVPIRKSSKDIMDFNFKTKFCGG